MQVRSIHTNDETEEEVVEEAVVEEAEEAEEVVESGDAAAFDDYPRPKMGTDGKLVVCVQSTLYPALNRNCVQCTRLILRSNTVVGN